MQTGKSKNRPPPPATTMMVATASMPLPGEAGVGEGV